MSEDSGSNVPPSSPVWKSPLPNDGRLGLPSPPGGCPGPALLRLGLCVQNQAQRQGPEVTRQPPAPQRRAVPCRAVPCHRGKTLSREQTKSEHRRAPGHAGLCPPHAPVPKLPPPKVSPVSALPLCFWSVPYEQIRQCARARTTITTCTCPSGPNRLGRHPLFQWPRRGRPVTGPRI